MSGDSLWEGRETLDVYLFGFFRNLKENDNSAYTSLKDLFNDRSIKKKEIDNIYKEINVSQTKISKSSMFTTSAQRHTANIKDSETKLIRLKNNLKEIELNIKKFILDFQCSILDKIKKLPTNDYTVNQFYNMDPYIFSEKMTKVINRLDTPSGGKSRRHRKKHRRKSRRHRH